MDKLPLALVLALLAPVACDQPDPGDDEAEVPQNVLMQDTLAQDAAASEDPEDGLTVVLEEWTVRPARDTIDATDGPTTFRVRNNGDYEHILEVEGQGNEWETDRIAPGDWATLEVELEPGTYELYCPIDDDHGEHEDLGMTAPLVVR